MKENSIERDEEILNNIKAYMQENIDKGFHKFIYNDLGYDEKCVDVINAIEHILSDYKRVLKENEKLKKKIDLMENYMVENGWEICFDNIYAELNNCNGMERDWCRGDKLEKQDIHKYFSKKLLESEE